MDTQRLLMSATAIHQQMHLGSMVRIVWQDEIWRVLYSNDLPEDRFEIVLRNRSGKIQDIEMVHIQKVFAEVSDYAIR